MSCEDGAKGLSLPQLEMLARVSPGPEFAVVAGLRGGDGKILWSLVEAGLVEADFDGPQSGYRLSASGRDALADAARRAGEAAADPAVEQEDEGDAAEAIDIHEQIAHHLDCIDALVAAAGEEAVTIAVSRRELATIIAGLHCWGVAFEQASSEKTDWPEWELASGADREFAPLASTEIDLLRRRLAA